jgi:toxin FitB
LKIPRPLQFKLKICFHLLWKSTLVYAWNFSLSCITIGEIQKGISRLPECQKKHNLHQWLESELLEQFAQKIITLDVKVTRVRVWGDIQAVAEKTGARMPAIDSLIASIGIAYGMTVVTRNAADMQVSGVRLFNPWD